MVYVDVSLSVCMCVWGGGGGYDCEGVMKALKLKRGDE